MSDEFEVIADWDGSVILRMPPDIAIELAKTFRRYNEYRIADGINPDSGWADIAAALEQI